MARRPLLTQLTLGTLAFLAIRPLLGLFHEALVLAMAGLLRWLTDLPLWTELVNQLPVDPVYTLAMIRFAGEIEVRGLAVAGLPGSLLQALCPGVFASPSLAETTWVSALIEPGATVLARGLVGFGADVGLLAIAIAVFLAGLRGRPWLAVCGALQQLHLVLYHFLDQQVSLRDLEAAGLPFAASTLLSPTHQRGPWFTSQLAELPSPLVSLAVGLLVAVLAYLLASTLVGLSLLLAWAGGRRPDLSRLNRPPRLQTASVAGLAVTLLALTPLGTFAETEPAVMLDADQQIGLAAELSQVTPPAARALARPAGPPTDVRFIGGGYRFQLLVNGVPTVVQGMGYNAEYAQLDPQERAERYDRDFAAMRAAGVNAIFGWFEQQFDQLTLDKAHQHGLGVGMPFELNQDLDYDDPALRARLTSQVLAQVQRYRDHPAVWFWTPGNEVIHRLVFPAWLRRQADPVRESRATSFAHFYVELIDQVNAIDPRHPVIYRDAEEVYLERIRQALARRPAPRPWFGYGANVYTRRLAQILADWPSQKIDAPLLLSEYAPGGTGPGDRPQALKAQWALIRSYPEWVIGGAVYTWTTDGPEELDRVFGLVDGDGTPRDGALAAITEAYRGAAASR